MMSPESPLFNFRGSSVFDIAAKIASFFFASFEPKSGWDFDYIRLPAIPRYGAE